MAARVEAPQVEFVGERRPQRRLEAQVALADAVHQQDRRLAAFAGIFDRTACLCQLCLDLKSEPGKRIGQFDMNPQELHEIWLKPRILGYADVLGVKLNVSDIGPDGKVEVTLAEQAG